MYPATPSSDQHQPLDPRPTPADGNSPDNGKEPKRRAWAWPVGAAFAFLLGAGVGAAGVGTDPDSSPEFVALAEERDGLSDELDAAQTRADEAEAAIAAAEERADSAEQASDRRSAELDEREAALGGRESEIAEQEAAVAEREAAVSATEERVPETNIHNGIWTVGVDVQPGTYRVAEALTDRCYWAILRTGTNGSDIIENDIPSGGFPSVTLSEGQDFENSCGVWNKQ